MKMRATKVDYLKLDYSLYILEISIRQTSIRIIHLQWNSKIHIKQKKQKNKQKKTTKKRHQQQQQQKMYIKNQN